MQDRRGVGRDAPLRAKLRIAVARMERGGVDGAAQQAHVAEPACAEEVGEFAGRHEGHGGPVVEAAHACEHQRRQPGETVMTGEIVEAGVEAGADGNAEPARRGQRTVAERTLGGDVDGVGSARLPMAQQA